MFYWLRQAGEHYFLTRHSTVVGCPEVGRWCCSMKPEVPPLAQGGTQITTQPQEGAEGQVKSKHFPSKIVIRQGPHDCSTAKAQSRPHTSCKSRRGMRSAAGRPGPQLKCRGKLAIIRGRGECRYRGK